jgi:hypothetical protein
MIPDTFALLKGGIMLLVDYDDAEATHRREDA